jgi:hypothetical protein
MTAIAIILAVILMYIISSQYKTLGEKDYKEKKNEDDKDTHKQLHAR